MPRLDAQHGIRRLPGSRFPHGLLDGAGERRFSWGLRFVTQEEPDVLQRAAIVVAVAAIAVHVAESGALRCRCRGDPRRLVEQRLGQADEQAPVDEKSEIHVRLGLKLGMQGAGIPLGRQLQSAEAENLG